MFLKLAGLVIYRFNYNFDEFDRALKKENLFDPKKANEQLKLFKELYNPDNDVNNPDKPQKLLGVLSESDKDELRKVFNKYDNLDQDEIQKQIDLLKSNF
mgnify:CR=1 FL=1